jgi:hypothetical protein
MWKRVCDEWAYLELILNSAQNLFGGCGGVVGRRRNSPRNNWIRSALRHRNLIIDTEKVRHLRIRGKA